MTIIYSVNMFSKFCGPIHPSEMHLNQLTTWENIYPCMIKICYHRIQAFLKWKREHLVSHTQNALLQSHRAILWMSCGEFSVCSKWPTMIGKWRQRTVLKTTLFWRWMDLIQQVKTKLKRNAAVDIVLHKP